MATKSKELGTGFNDTVSKKAGRAELLNLVRAQEFRCALTGDALECESAEVDHIVPRCNGGTNCIDNLQIVTKEVNRMKGSMSNEEFIAICRKVAQWTR